MSGASAADVLVVGAGPAGCSAAWSLARHGLRVRLLDASAFPRSKPCGEAVSPGAAPFLRELGIEGRLEAAGAARVRGWRIRAPSGAWLRGEYADAAAPSPAWGWAVLRSELDELLLRAAVAAGADFRPRQRVYRLVRSGERVTGVVARDGKGVDRRFSARIVVGADGLRSRVARLLGGVRRGRRRRLALVGRVEADGGAVADSDPDVHSRSRPAEDDPRRVEDLQPEFGELRLAWGGLVGLAPLGRGRWNATVVVSAAEAVDIRGDVEGFYRDRLAAFGAPAWLADARRLGKIEVTGPFELYPSRITAEGLLLAGDAVGYFDPFTGQGVYRALATGRMAAQAAVAALERPERERAERRRYARAVRRFLTPGRAVQRLVDAVVFRPGLMNRIAPVLSARPGLADLLVDVTGDRLPPGALASPRRLARALATRGNGNGRGNGITDTR